MIARKAWAEKYAEWNRQWGSPAGLPTRKFVPRQLKLTPIGARLVGPFSFQPNNDTRGLEYPWAFEALGPRKGMRVLDVGGSLAGLQFVLDRGGCEVVNVDPGEESRGRGWPVSEETFRRLNHAFGTRVTLKKCFLQDAGLAAESFDRVVSISVLEHVPENDIESILLEARRLLKPGGLMVLTLDLFLNVKPFAEAVSNEYGHNVSARWMMEKSGMELVHGTRAELNGFDEFDVEAICANQELYVSTKYPVMAQTMVLRKS
jgi:2-polyprenyl-3-methyl-5-hydroxy-6-metoxy-1,4-benzoquinol methylase